MRSYAKQKTDEACCKAVEEVHTKEYASLSLVTSVVTSSKFSAGHLIHREGGPPSPAGEGYGIPSLANSRSIFDRFAEGLSW